MFFLVGTKSHTCAHGPAYPHWIYTCVCMYLYMYLYMHICVCVYCICMLLERRSTLTLITLVLFTEMFDHPQVPKQLLDEGQPAPRRQLGGWLKTEAP